jgi:hypothetical protein
MYRNDVDEVAPFVAYEIGVKLTTPAEAMAGIQPGVRGAHGRRRHWNRRRACGVPGVANTTPTDAMMTTYLRCVR